MTRGTEFDRAIDILHEDPLLLIERLQGEGRRLVVAVSGIGHGFDGMQRVEFAGTASDGGRNTVLFVTDRTRSWFTADGIVARIAEVVQAELARLGLPACHTIGNSMGGYGAIRLARDMPVAVSLAFSPQASMDPSLIAEHRWPEHRPAIVMVRHLPLSACIAPHPPHAAAQYFAVFGAAARIERNHRALLPDAPNLTCLMLLGGGHNIVRVLKGTGHLLPLVEAAMDGDAARVAAVTADFAAATKGGLKG